MMLTIYTQEITTGDKVFHTTTEESPECLWGMVLELLQLQ
jgi:hypothetical protein